MNNIPYDPTTLVRLNNVRQIAQRVLDKLPLREGPAQIDVASHGQRVRLCVGKRFIVVEPDDDDDRTASLVAELLDGGGAPRWMTAKTVIRTGDQRSSSQ